MLSMLPVASPVEATSSMESTSTVKRVAAVKASTLKTAAVEACVPVESTVTMPSAGTKVVPSAVVAVAVETAATIVAMEPRTRADKHAPDKVIGAVIPVRRASVGRIPVVAVGADRSRPDIRRPTIDRPHSYSKPNPDLSVSSPRACHGHKKSKQNCVF